MHSHVTSDTWLSCFLLACSTVLKTGDWAQGQSESRTKLNQHSQLPNHSANIEPNGSVAPRVVSTLHAEKREGLVMWMMCVARDRQTIKTRRLGQTSCTHMILHPRPPAFQNKCWEWAWGRGYPTTDQNAELEISLHRWSDSTSEHFTSLCHLLDTMSVQSHVCWEKCKKWSENVWCPTVISSSAMHQRRLATNSNQSTFVTIDIACNVHAHTNNCWVSTHCNII